MTIIILITIVVITCLIIINDGLGKYITKIVFSHNFYQSFQIFNCYHNSSKLCYTWVKISWMWRIKYWLRTSILQQQFSVHWFIFLNIQWGIIQMNLIKSIFDDYLGRIQNSLKITHSGIYMMCLFLIIAWVLLF